VADVAILIVRRGLSREYYDFLNVAVAANRDKLVIDRRRGEGRLQVDSGPDGLDSTDRRAAPPETWTRDDVIVVPS
jgi:hypothetical protein